MKQCVTCHKTKSFDDFAVWRQAKDGRQNRCRDCYRAWYDENRLAARLDIDTRRASVRAGVLVDVAAYLREHPCVDCGETDVRTLEFDHRPSETKRWNVSQMLSGAWNWSSVLEEIAKCDVRCANCHRRVTMARASYWRESAYQEQLAERSARATARLNALFPQSV